MKKVALLSPTLKMFSKAIVFPLTVTPVLVTSAPGKFSYRSRIWDRRQVSARLNIVFITNILLESSLTLPLG